MGGLEGEAEGVEVHWNLIVTHGVGGGAAEEYVGYGADGEGTGIVLFVALFGGTPIETALPHEYSSGAGLALPTILQKQCPIMQHPPQSLHLLLRHLLLQFPISYPIIHTFPLISLYLEPIGSHSPIYSLQIFHSQSLINLSIDLNKCTHGHLVLLCYL